MKRTVAILVIGILLLTFCSCADNRQNTEIDINSLGEYVAENGAFSEKLEPVSSQTALMSFGLEDSGAEAVEYATSSAVAEIFAAFKGDDVDLIRKAVQEKIDYLKESYASYGPQEVPKIESAVLITQGNCVIFCISADNTDAKNLIEDFINK
ncbi:MAG: DUF4358 domain-containing protein [Clostridia bacterium]|nr:DUF4358 domain-containing protein [Clostridia bacterium]